MTMKQRTDGLSEKQLVQQAQLGDKEAFARLYETHKQRVYAICLRITREKTEAEDCAQEAFLQCFLRLSTFRGESALSTWLYRLTVNVVLMRLRANHVKPVSLDTSGTAEDFGESAILNACPVDDMRLSGAIDRITLHRALRELPPGYRTIFLLHDVEGKAHSEIARQLGCSIGNSKSQLHQARTRLRRFLRRPLGRLMRQPSGRAFARESLPVGALREHRPVSTGFPRLVAQE
jgi:RNA polymerase sigma-70 factor (ECF subfamily)